MISTVWILVSDGGETGVHIYLFIITQRASYTQFKRAQCGVFGWDTAFKAEMMRVRIQCGGWGYSLT